MKITERGWAGHFICAKDCLFRRNTLLEYDKIKIVVSTVGALYTSWEKGNKFYKGPFMEIGVDRYYETKAFHSNKKDSLYHDIDVEREINFSSQWAIDSAGKDNEANEMHEKVVAEISARLLGEDKFEGR